MELTLVAERFQRATEEIGKVLVGQHELVEATLIALFSEGNILIEGTFEDLRHSEDPFVSKFLREEC